VATKVKKTTGNPADRFGGAGPGRPKGVQNKVTKELKEMILQALDNKGGVAYLEQQADANPNAFLSLIGKVLPMTVQGPGEGGEHSLVITWRE
jgi:hypothetical protein